MREYRTAICIGQYRDEIPYRTGERRNEDRRFSFAILQYVLSIPRRSLVEKNYPTISNTMKLRGENGFSKYMTARGGAYSRNQISRRGRFGFNAKPRFRHRKRLLTISTKPVAVPPTSVKNHLGNFPHREQTPPSGGYKTRFPKTPNVVDGSIGAKLRWTRDRNNRRHSAPAWALCECNRLGGGARDGRPPFQSDFLGTFKWRARDKSVFLFPVGSA